jgi:tetratricopeptide (TPR) repeat protein
MNLADCYRLLGLRTGASYDDIRAAYRRLAWQYHPDANPNQQPQAQTKFIQLTEAYRQLTEAMPAEVRSPLNDFPSDSADSITETAIETEKADAIASPIPIVDPVRPSFDPPAFDPRDPVPPAHHPVHQVLSQPEETAKNAVLSDRQRKEITYQQLQRLLKESRYPRAIALIEELARLLPNDVEVRQWQAITYQRFGRYLINTHNLDRARAYLHKALRTAPHNRALWFEVERDLSRIDPAEIL